jgi:RimJ/RimL family protein N-acetyltransferase
VGLAAPVLPAGFQFAEVDTALLHDPTLAKRQELLEEICSERASTADFLARSFGTVLLHERAVAGWCLSEYNCQQHCEVGIAIDEPYRRRGLATVLGSAFRQQALAASAPEIGWHCWEGNVASCATAQALGFSLVRAYTAHVVRLALPRPFL